ncbi:MAG: hypothetical protein NC484_02475 [Alloprevotella sp.]|nr:hypothetical protein [Alloprevotella sp.]
MRARIYIVVVAAVAALLAMSQLTDDFPRRYGGRWQPDEGDTQGYIVQLTADSLLTVPGHGRSLMLVTADSLERRMNSVAIKAARLKTSSPLFDAVWDYAWNRLSACPPTLSSLYLTLPIMAHSGDEVAEYLRKGYPGLSEASDDSWPLADERGLMWIEVAGEYLLASGNDSFGSFAAVGATDILMADSCRYYDVQTGLWRGGGDGKLSGGLPEWMTVADRFNVVGLAHNVMAAEAYRSAAVLYAQSGDFLRATRMMNEARGMASRISEAMWLPVEGRYSQYLYGRLYRVASPASSGRGNALAALSEIVSDYMTASRVVTRLPRTPYGLMTTYPPTDDLESEADALTQGLWAMACGRVADGRALWNAMSILVRLVCLDAMAGDSQDVDCNAAFIGAVAKSLFGIRAEPEGLRFIPCVAPELGNEVRLTGVAYRDATLDITVSGTGERIASFSIDGFAQESPIFPVGMDGHHTVRIEMVAATSQEGERISDAELPVILPQAMPEMEEPEWISSASAALATTAHGYAVIVNGERVEDISAGTFTLDAGRAYRETLIAPLGEKGRPAGYMAEPHVDCPDRSSVIIQAEWYAARELARDIYRRMYRHWSRQKARGRADSSTRPNRRLTQIVALPSDKSLTFTLEATDTSTCVVEIGYAQGRDAGRRATPLRALDVNGATAAILALPRQIDGGDTTITVTSLPVAVKLMPGHNRLTLHSESPKLRRGGKNDTVMIDFLRITSL